MGCRIHPSEQALVLVTKLDETRHICRCTYRDRNFCLVKKAKSCICINVKRVARIFSITTGLAIRNAKRAVIHRTPICPATLLASIFVISTNSYQR